MRPNTAATSGRCCTCRPSARTGARFWPAWYPLEALERIKANIGDREWQSQYQGDPTPEQGNFFRREWLRYYSLGELPERMAHYGASDYATKHAAGDFTVHGVAGVSPSADVFIVDWWREQASSDVWIEALIDLMQRWETRIWAEEAGQIEKSVGPFLYRRMRERGVWRRREAYASAADKPTRARSIEGRFAMGMVHLPRGAPYTSVIVDELLKFPAARHDDCVDVLSLMGRMLGTMRGAGAQAHRDTRPRIDIDTPRGMVRRIALEAPEVTFGDLVRHHDRQIARARRTRA